VCEQATTVHWVNQNSGDIRGIWEFMSPTFKQQVISFFFLFFVFRIVLLFATSIPSRSVEVAISFFFLVFVFF
jgi:hypothetical protein